MIKLKNSVRREPLILDIIERNPGIQFREIMRKADMKNGVLSHYLGKLEKMGSVKVERSPRQTRFYSLQITDDETGTINALRRETPRNILYALLLQDGLEFNQIVEHVCKSSSTISLYLSQLVQENIVTMTLEIRRKTYHLANKLLVDRLIEDYRPGLLEKPTSGFEDVINSL